MVIIDRDKKNLKLEADLFGKMSDIVKVFEPENKKDKDKNNLAVVSVEDAIKELLAMGEKI
jgi:hypothetical protein